MSDTQWHYTQHGMQQTPIGDTEFRQRVADGRILPGDMVWCQGMPQWTSAAHVPGLFPTAVLPPPTIGATPVMPYGMPQGHYASPTDIGQNAGMRMLLPVGRSGWAIAAGYLGLLSFLIFPAPIALIVSIIALAALKKNPKLHGMGRAIFGLIMGILGTIGLIAMLASAIVGQHR